MAKKSEIKIEELARMIDRLGDLGNQIKVLEAEEAGLKATVKESMKPDETLSGQFFIASLTESTPMVPDPAKVFKAVPQKVFFEIATVSIKALKDHLLPAEIDKVSSPGEPRKTLNVKAIRKGGAN